MYYVALEGVSRYALSEAVKAIVRGALGHTFFPSPVELRQQCDAAMRPIHEHQRRVDQLERQARDREEFEAAKAAQSPEAKARVAAMVAKLRKDMGWDKPKQEPAFKIDPELLKDVPYAPSTFRKSA